MIEILTSVALSVGVSTVFAIWFTWAAVKGIIMGVNKIRDALDLMDGRLDEVDGALRGRYITRPRCTRRHCDDDHHPPPVPPFPEGPFR